MMLVTEGILRYSEIKNGWIVIDCDPQIGKYYRKLYSLLHYNCKIMFAPSWKEHVTVLRNEKPLKNQTDWGMYDASLVEVKYKPITNSNGQYYWFDVECEFALELREHFGLPRQPEFPLHITISS